MLKKKLENWLTNSLALNSPFILFITSISKFASSCWYLFDTMENKETAIYLNKIKSILEKEGGKD